MPIYEYTCPACKVDFEVFHRNGSTEAACPQCGGAEVKRKLSAFSFSAPGADMPMAMPPGGCGRCGSDTPGQCGLA